MQCVQRVYNLPVSVDQQTRPDWKYSSAYCLWTWTGEVQKLLSTLSKTDTFQSSTRCWRERGVISLLIYRIFSNNGCPSNNHPPPPTFDGNIWINRPLPTPLAIFSFFYPFKLMSNLIQQNWSVTIQALKINQGTKFGTLKKPMFSLFDEITFLFKWIIKQNF